jgi:hypothetical protein
MANFIPRVITQESAAQGYNNEGRGKLLGYVARPSEHEETCRYRISTGGDPNKEPHEPCSCRIGLWKDETMVKGPSGKVQKSKALRKPRKVSKRKPVRKAKNKG